MQGDRKMKRYYYAAVNSYASDVSHGFGNTWYVMVFNSKESRDNYVEDQEDLCTCAIKRNEVIYYAKRNYDYSTPKPFSGESWVIDMDYDDEVVKGHIGDITVASISSCHDARERFYGKRN